MDHPTRADRCIPVIVIMFGALLAPSPPSASAQQRFVEQRTKQERIATLQREALPGDNPPAFHRAAYRDDVEVLRSLLSKSALSSKDPDNGWTALHYAAMGNSLEAARMLLEAGASVNLGSGSAGVRPLMLATVGEHTEMVHLLLSHKADPRARGIENITALHIAAFNLDYDVVCLLLASGAPAGIVVTDEGTPADFARAGLERLQNTIRQDAMQRAPRVDVRLIKCRSCDGTGRRSPQEMRRLASVGAGQLAGTGQVRSISATCPKCDGAGGIPDAASQRAAEEATRQVEQLTQERTRDAREVHDAIVTILKAFLDRQDPKTESLRSHVLTVYAVDAWPPTKETSGSTPESATDPQQRDPDQTTGTTPEQGK